MRGKTIVGVDVGGTFTDIFLLDETAELPSVYKVASTRGEEAIGFANGLAASGVPLSDIGAIVHGTTVGTNALLERRGARCGLITTKGFRDVLEMRRRDRPTTWGLRGSFTPIIPRELRLEVRERVLADGTILEKPDREEIVAAARELLAKGCVALVVAFINAHASAANEKLAVEAIRAMWPNPHVAASHEILPEIREFERMSTAALNGYLQPVVATYLDRLEAGLRKGGFSGDFLVVQSNGGVMTAAAARARPVRTALSGPAAGVIACAAVASASGYRNVVTCDMGGTSFDVSLIADGQMALGPQTAIDFGLVVRSPMIEITTIGAGGGSIARVDTGGLLEIGPESAGSNPGPVCYGRGNSRPTVTDANVVLGRLDAERPIGALPRLDVKAASKAIADMIGAPLGLSTLDAAEAIIRVANSRMAGALRLVSIERGHDPRHFAMLPFGGGGALHAGALIREVGFQCALVPRFPGVLSALGCTIADMRYDFVRTINGLISALPLAEIEEAIAAFRDEGEKRLTASGISFVARSARIEFDMCYLGQTHTVAVPYPVDVKLDQRKLEEAFAARYRTSFGRLLPNVAIRLLNLRVAVIGERPKLDFSRFAPRGSLSIENARRGTRDVYFGGTWRETQLFDRLALPAGAQIEGPAILSQPDTTIVVEPGQKARVDDLGNLIIGAA